MCQQVTANRSGDLRWGNCFASNIHVQTTGVHLKELDEVLDSQSIMINLTDEILGVAHAFRLWFYAITQEREDRLRSFCPAGWMDNELNITSHPTVVSALLTNKFYPLISEANAELEGWELLTKRLKNLVYRWLLMLPKD